MSDKPIEVRKKGAGWFVFVRGVPIVRVGGKLWIDRALAGIPSDGSQPPIPVGTLPHRFGKKSDAEAIAHQIGRYMLGLGSFVWTYTKLTTEKPNGDVVEVHVKER